MEFLEDEEAEEEQFSRPCKRRLNQPPNDSKSQRSAGLGGTTSTQPATPFIEENASRVLQRGGNQQRPIVIALPAPALAAPREARGRRSCAGGTPKINAVYTVTTFADLTASLKVVEEEEQLSRPCNGHRLLRLYQQSDNSKPEGRAGGINSTQLATPSIERRNIGKRVLQRRGNLRRPIVCALAAPSLDKTSKNSSIKRKNMIKNSGSRETRGKRPCAGGTAEISAVYRVTDLSCSCCDMLRKLKLRGCAVVSKGILVVEGGMDSIRNLLKVIGRKDQPKGEAESVEVIWQGRIDRPSFGKFSILHCNSDIAVGKFFADHGALSYWNLAINSTLD